MEFPVTDAPLVHRAKLGDTGAFEQLVRAYHRRAVSLAYRLLGNVEDANDVSQDAFVRAYRNLAQLDDANRFGGWLLRIVGNLSLNFRRARKTRSAASLDDTVLAGFEAAAPPGKGREEAGTRGDGEPMSAELQGVINKALQDLPEHQRIALVLFSIEGLPQKEVADILDCSVEMVKWNVFQARKKMKDSLKDYL